MNRPARTARRTIALQDAKAHFSEVVAAAMRGEEQYVTRRGKPAVVIVGAADFERLAHANRAAKSSFIDHLLSIPKTPKSERHAVASRLKLRPRDVDLSP